MFVILYLIKEAVVWSWMNDSLGMSQQIFYIQFLIANYSISLKIWLIIVYFESGIFYKKLFNRCIYNLLLCAYITINYYQFIISNRFCCNSIVQNSKMIHWKLQFWVQYCDEKKIERIKTFNRNYSVHLKIF